VLMALTALSTFELEDDLLGGLDLLVEDWLCLTTETSLFAVITTLTLGSGGSLTSLLLPSDGM
jgi:hypothetical protein